MEGPPRRRIGRRWFQYPIEDELLVDRHGAERIGAAAQARMRDHFLGPRHLGQHVELLERVLPGR